MKVTYRVVIAIFSFLALVAIRAFEDFLFYDPYLEFFQNDYLYIDSPRREIAKLVFFTTLRYFLNSICSLSILLVVFQDKGILKFSIVLFVLAYFLLIIPFLYFVINPRQEDYYIFFNLRRFLIQPLFLILLLPAFYYHKIKR